MSAQPQPTRTRPTRTRPTRTRPTRTRPTQPLPARTGGVGRRHLASWLTPAGSQEAGMTPGEQRDGAAGDDALPSAAAAAERSGFRDQPERAQWRESHYGRRRLAVVGLRCGFDRAEVAYTAAAVPERIGVD